MWIDRKDINKKITTPKRGIRAILILFMGMLCHPSLAQYEPNPILPDTIFLALGNDLELFNDNVAFVRLDDYTYTYGWEYDVGSSTSLKWYWTADQLGTFNLRFIVYESGSEVDEASTVLKVLPKESGQSFTMLAIGNSLTNSGFSFQFEEIQADLNIDLSTMGTQGTTIKHEGYSGWTFADHLGTSSPFYFEGTIDFNQYLDSNFFQRPDIIRVYLGINDCFSNATMEYVRQNANWLLQEIRADFPNTLIIIAMPTLCENTGEGWLSRYGDMSNYERYQLRIREFWQYLLDNYSGSNGSDWIQVSYEGLCIDRYYGYPLDGTEHIESVHPNPFGYRLLSRGLSNTLNRYVPMLYGIGDIDPPTTPDGLSLETATSSTLNISWNPATDNVGVSAYNIFLDNAFVGNTIGTSYTISGLSPGTLYTVTISAVDAEGNESARSGPLSAGTLAVPDTEAPSVPAGLVETGKTHNSIQISWEESVDNVGVEGYRVFRDDTEVGTTGEPGYSFNGLVPGTSYSLSVTSYDKASNESARSLALSVSTLIEVDNEAPTTPTDVEATNVSSSSAEFSWSPSSDNLTVAGYRIFVDGNEHGSSGDTSYTVTGLNPSTQYIINVSAYDASQNESALSEPIMITTISPDTEAPSIPEGITITGVTGSSISFMWDHSTDNVKVEGYRIYTNGEAVDSSVLNKYTLSGLLSETLYSLSLTAYDASSNESAHSSAIVVRTESADSLAPSAPTGLTALDVTENTISLQWNHSVDDHGVSGYYIYMDNSLWGSALSNSLTLNNLDPGTKYSFHVSAFDATGNVSDPSDILNVTTGLPDTEAPTVPEDLVTSTVGMTTIGIAWIPSSDNVGVTGYNIYANGLLRGSTPFNAYTLTQLDMGLEYEISVSAFDHATNESDLSLPIRITTFNPDSTSNPSFPELSVIQSQQVNDRARILTEIVSYGYTELQDFGMLVSPDSSSLDEAWFIETIPEDMKIIHEGRVTDNLQALYDFSNQNSNTIFDISGKDESYNLSVSPTFNSHWLTAQGLDLFSSTLLSSKEPATALTSSLKATNEISIEAWIKPARTNQEGSPNIISLSSLSDQQVISIRHEGNQGFYDYQVRLRTSETDGYGNPAVSTLKNYINPELQHLVYTRSQSGVESIYINGSVAFRGVREGDFSSWDEDYYLELGNLRSDNAPWNGTFYLVAIYNRGLLASEVLGNYNSGPGNIYFSTEVKNLSPGETYYAHPLARTDQGVVHGDTLSLIVENKEFPSEQDSIQMKLYPNPSNGNFNIYIEDNTYSRGEALLKISDLSGRVVYTDEYKLSDSFFTKEVTLGLSGILEDGFYSVMLFIDSKAAARKLIIQN